MSTHEWMVLGLFVVVFAGIIMEKVDKAVIAIGGAIFVIVAHLIEFDHAMHAIDFKTIGLLLGMMLMVACLQELHLFEWIALRLALLTRGSPVLIFIVFGAASAVFSAFLDNVTTVLIIIPLVITITRGIGLAPKPFILTIIFLSNIGGAATLIGDPPNILVGSKVDSITFLDFPKYMLVPVVISAVGAVWFMRRCFATHIQSRSTHFGWLFASSLMLERVQRQAASLKIPQDVTLGSSIIGLLVLLGFFTHGVTHIEPAVIAMAGAVLMLAVFHRRLDLHHLMQHVEWTTLLFFAGLFVIVGAAEEVHLLETISHGLVSMTDNLWVLLMIVLWASAILSGIVDNIPFVAVMIPVLTGLLGEGGPYQNVENSHLLWWALVMGACFGGNATMIGASANVVSCGLAKREGVHISFVEFARISAPTTAITIVVSMIYLTFLYWL